MLWRQTHPPLSFTQTLLLLFLNTVYSLLSLRLDLSRLILAVEKKKKKNPTIKTESCALAHTERVICVRQFPELLSFPSCRRLPLQPDLIYPLGNKG